MNTSSDARSSASSPVTPKTFTIAGAGLVGSLMALFLARRGYTVNVFERRSDMRTRALERGRSINLALSDRGRRALEAAGVAANLDAIGIPMHGRMIHARDSSLAFQQYGKTGEAIYSVSRAGLNHALLDAAEAYPEITLHFEERCTDVDLATGGAQFQHRENAPRSIPADCIIGTDGAYSAVRSVMQRSGRFDFEQIYLDHGYKELTIPAGANGTWLLERNALHIWPRARYMLIALPNLDGSFTCTLFLPFEAAFEGDVCFENMRDEASIHTVFEQLFPDVLPLMPTLADDFLHNPNATLVTIRCSPWVHGGTVMLAGDAAHAIVPFYGQGMNAGFEDCRVFDELLAAYEQRERGGGELSGVLQTYQHLRKPNGDAIAELAKRNFVEMSERVADPRFLVRKKIEQHCHALYPNAFLPVYSMVTFSHIPYVEALAEMERQETLFANVMALPGIDDGWNTPDGEAAIADCMRFAGYAV
jgi:kynurenine 3-monooxygenase